MSTYFPTFAPILALLAVLYVTATFYGILVWLVESTPYVRSTRYQWSLNATSNETSFLAAWNDAKAFDSCAIIGTDKAAKAAQANQLRIARQALVGHNARLVLKALSAGQSQYLAIHGHYPVDRKAFAFAAFSFGIDAACEYGGF